MAIQLSTAIRNNQASQIEGTIGNAPKLQIWSGSPPANCAAADTGTMLAELTLPSDWLTAASGGAVTRNGTWSGTGAATGTAGHFRIKDSTGTTCGLQGTVTMSGGGGDLILDNTAIAIGQAVAIASFSHTVGNA